MNDRAIYTSSWKNEREREKERNFVSISVRTIVHTPSRERESEQQVLLAYSSVLLGNVTMFLL